MTFRWEHELFAPVSRFLRNRGFAQQIEEAQFYEYHLDIFAFSRRSELSVSVELKLTKWTRAVEQALVYQLCTDLVYVAVPKATVPRVGTDLLDQHGIGLISVEPHRCREVLKPRQSGVLRDYYRQQLVELTHHAAEIPKP